jgi:hypothetical protein
MSDSERPEGAESSSNAASARALDLLVTQARTDLDVRADLDWDRLEARLMTEVDDAKLVAQPSGGRARLLRAARVGALAFAAAAAVVVFVRQNRGTATNNIPVHVVESAPASSLQATEGAGEVRIARVAARPGSVVRASDSIEVDGARAVFEREGKVSWLVEQDGAGSAGARARVKSAGEALILDLAHGAIEAQVVPVPVGEAFAVDIATERSLVRVAVHGTHLRVARSGNRVVVDLTEGVIAIGVPPKSGITTGTTVTAPAHVELDATDLTTLRIDRAPETVRPPIPLGARAVVARADNPSAASPPVVLAPSPVSAPKPPTTHVEPKAKHEAPKVALPAREAIAAAVRECGATRSRPGNVQVTVNSSLNLRVSAAGVVESAQFSPPLSPEVQTCAAAVIYRTKVDEPGAVTIPIEFSY